MPSIKFLFMIVILVTLTACGPLNWFFGIDDQGNPSGENSPSSYLLAVLKGLGPWGALASAGVAAGGAAYVGNKKSKDPLKSVINAVEIAKETMKPDDLAFFKGKLKTHIPSKYHRMIDQIRGKV